MQELKTPPSPPLFLKSDRLYGCNSCCFQTKNASENRENYSTLRIYRPALLSISQLAGRGLKIHQIQCIRSFSANSRISFIEVFDKFPTLRRGNDGIHLNLKFSPSQPIKIIRSALRSEYLRHFHAN